MNDPITYNEVFTRVVDWVLVAEGVLSDDKQDTGGITKYGHDTQSWPATLARLPDDVRRRMPRDVRDLDRALSVEAYFWGYWRWWGCHLLPPWAALLTFDGAVNGGDPRRWLQHAVGVAADGVVGKVTLAAVARLRTADQIIEAAGEYQAWHLAYLSSLGGKWQAFGASYGQPHGWSRRLFAMCLDAVRIEQELGEAIAAPPPHT